MMTFLRRLINTQTQPVTHLNVTPACRDQEREREVKEELNKLTHAVINTERRSWQIREELAGNVQKLVGGD